MRILYILHGRLNNWSIIKLMRLKILQWNVFYKEDPDRIAEEIVRIDPDVVCGQELIQHLSAVPSIDTAKQIAEKIKYQYIYQVADTWTDRKDKSNQGNAIFSKFPITASSYQHVQEPKVNPPDPQYEGRVYVEVLLDIQGRQLTVGTTHLSYFRKFEITSHRKNEIDNLLSILKEKKNNYVFTGDLNSLPNSYTIQEILNLERFQNPGPDFKQKTWTTKPFDYDGFSEDRLNWRLDYVFATRDVKVLSSKIVKTEVSDHLPVLLEIEL